MKGTVFDIQRFSVHDGPGIRTTVFLKGCRLNCKWCQNPEGISTGRKLVWWEGKCSRSGRCVSECPHSALSLSKDGLLVDAGACVLCGRCVEVCPEEALSIVGKDMTVEDILSVVERDRIFYETSGGGMTLSGGDPLMQAEFSAALLSACRDIGIHTVVETGLCCKWEDAAMVIPYADLMLIDFKLMDPQEHKRWTGQHNNAIKENFERICGQDVKKVLRITLVPGMTATEANVRAISEYVFSIDRCVPIELLNFNPLCKSKYERLGKEYMCSSANALTGEEMAAFEEIVKAAGCVLYRETVES